MRRITRVNQLYSVPETKTKNRKGEVKVKPARVGRLPFARSYTYANLILHDENDPFIPGTKVRRLKLLRLSATAAAVFDDEVDALLEGLRAHRDAARA